MLTKPFLLFLHTTLVFPKACLAWTLMVLEVAKVTSGEGWAWDMSQLGECLLQVQTSALHKPAMVAHSSDTSPCVAEAGRSV